MLRLSGEGVLDKGGGFAVYGPMREGVCWSTVSCSLVNGLR